MMPGSTRLRVVCVPALASHGSHYIVSVLARFSRKLPLTYIVGLSYNQMNNNLTSQAATMERNGVPNDIITNLNPISLVIFIPIVDAFLYPNLRKAGINAHQAHGFRFHPRISGHGWSRRHSALHLRHG
jgi:hypothetical protein